MWKSDVESLEGFLPEVYPEDYHFMLRALEAGISFYSLASPALHWRDYGERTSKISEDYSSENFNQLRVQFLCRYLSTQVQRPISILGTGPSGKRLLLDLKDQGLGIHSVVALKRSSELLHNTPVYLWHEQEEFKDNFLVVAIGSKQRGPEIEMTLQKTGRRPGIDYILFG